MGLIKVLIIDDSAVVRKILSQELDKDEEIEVIGTASNPYIGRDKIVKLNPDVLLLDIEMPRMDGLTFLEKLMRYYPLPVIIVSSLARRGSEVALKALDLGAAEIIAKPGPSYSVGDMSVQLIEKVKAVYVMRKSPKYMGMRKSFKNNSKKTNSSNKLNSSKIIISNKSLIKTTNKIIAIGASTGGTEAIKYILSRLPASMPPILIVQHMPERFTSLYAESLNEICAMKVKEGEDGELVMPGKALIAPGNRHMELSRSGARYFIKIKDGPLVFHQRPSVEILFNSVADYAGLNSIGVILTGMGKDGAKGLLQMKEAGAHTIAQDEESCIVYGMPREAVALGAARQVESLEKIPQLLVEILDKLD